MTALARLRQQDSQRGRVGVDRFFSQIDFQVTAVTPLLPEAALKAANPQHAPRLIDAEPQLA